jgi:CBS domain-containing protein
VFDPRPAYVVVDEGPLGVISPLQLALVPKERWPWTVVTQIMTPWRQLAEVSPETTLLDSLQKMQTIHSPYLAVRDSEGNVAGILLQDQIAFRVQAAAQA